jgi:hypothetical protein
MRQLSLLPLLLAAAAAAAAPALAGYPPPPPGWRSHFFHAGAYAGFTLESTPFFLRGRWYMMQSEASDHFAPDGAAHTYFSVRDFATGEVVAAPPASSGFSFFSAAVDAARGVVWVFGAALDRFNRTVPAACPWGGHLRDNSTRCFIQAFSSSDLVTWTSARALEVPPWEDAALIIANVGAALVPGGARAAPGVPAHQAFMALETTVEGAGAFAVNTGTDGDLSRGWVLLNRTQFALKGPWQCPFTRYDASSGYYYVVGMAPGGTAPYVSRSKSLAAGSWEFGPPVSQGCAWGWEPCADGRVAEGVYTHAWRNGTANSSTLPFLPNMTRWMWSTSDIDAADDGTEMRYIWSGNAQSAPANFSGRSSCVSGLGRRNGTVLDFLASLFV